MRENARQGRSTVRTSLLLLLCVLAACSATSPSAQTPSSSATPTDQGVAGALPTLVLRPAGYRLSAPIQRAVAVSSGGTVYIAGGLDAAGTTVGGVFAMNPATGSLSYLGSLPRAAHDAAGSMIGGRLFVFGGGSSAGTDLVQAFDPANGNGVVAGHLPRVLSDLSAATIGGTTYLVGGYDGARPRPEIYATSDGTRFRLVATLPVGLRYPAVAAVDGTLVVAGGNDAAGPTDGIYLVDPVAGTVERAARLPAPVAHAAAFTIAGITYVAGGRNASDASVARMSAVDTASGSVSTLPPLPRPTADAAVAPASGGVLLIGGWGGHTLDQVLRGGPASSGTPAARPSPTPQATADSSAQTKRPFAGLLLIADRGNNRLLVMNAHKHIVWRYPSPSLPPPPDRFYFPDDAFWVHGGHAILVNEEENNLIAEIAYPSGRTLWTYGHAGIAGSSPGYLHQPDDAYPMPGGGVVVADAKNCRILFLNAAGSFDHQIGTNGVCTHGFPATVGYPNGDTPLPNGHLLISELNGAWVDEVASDGRVIWARRPPGVVEPSDPQRLADGTYLVANYARPGAVIRFDRGGKVLWSYHVAAGHGMLDHPSLAAPLPNGLVAVNDDFRHRVVLIDPATNRIVWQYGTGTSGSGAGQLSFPDGLDLLLPGNAIPLHVDFASQVVKAGQP